MRNIRTEKVQKQTHSNLYNGIIQEKIQNSDKTNNISFFSGTRRIYISLFLQNLKRPNIFGIDGTFPPCRRHLSTL